MTTLRQSAELALEALSAMLTHMGMDEDDWNKPTFNQCRKAEAALRERLAQPEQEPVATVYDAYDATGIDWHCKDAPATGTKLYTSPPQRTWVGLADEEVLSEAKRFALGLSFPFNGITTPEMFARAIEAKLKEKNT